MRFVLIDRLLALEPGRRASARVVFSSELEIFKDHFPGRAVVPGTLLTESMAQTGGWLLGRTVHFERWPVLTIVREAKFFRFALPGETIELDAVVHSSRSHDFEIHAEAQTAGRRLARARLLYHAQELPASTPETIAFQIWARETFTSLGGDEL